MLELSQSFLFNNLNNIGHVSYSRETVEMEASYGYSLRGQKTLIFDGFEYLKARANKNGTTSWRCLGFQRHKCNARLLTLGLTIHGNRHPAHTHKGNETKS